MQRPVFRRCISPVFPVFPSQYFGPCIFDVEAALMAETYYEILGIIRRVSREEMRAAFVRRAAPHHPDGINVSTGTSAQEFLRAAEAFAVLYDAKLRFRYDAHLKSGSM